MAMLAGKNMIKNRILLESDLFSPPFVSASIETIKNKKVKHGLIIASSFVTAGLAIAVKAKENHQVKMGNIGVKGVERVAAQHFIAGLFMDAIGKVLHEPIHLLPLANLTVNLKCARDLKEARGLHQWWRLDE
ncbi:hypothetical protein Tco_0543309 [Tanacetum coccineum]